MNTKADNINKEKLPVHIAVIMDGNGRWAEKHGKERIFGHQNGVTPVREVAEACAELGVKYLTLYTFSKENWNRPDKEVNALMQMLVATIANEEKTLMDNGIRFHTIGDRNGLADDVCKALDELADKTSDNSRMTLVLALNYSSRWEITEAVKAIASDVKDNIIGIGEINTDMINSYLTTKDIPDPDLLIRTSGELRLSNYLLWQIAYTELYFTDVLWPDFTKDDLYDAIIDYQKRSRRFGKITE